MAPQEVPHLGSAGGGRFPGGWERLLLWLSVSGLPRAVGGHVASPLETSGEKEVITASPPWGVEKMGSGRS